MPGYIGSLQPDDADSVRSSRPASVRSGSSGYISGAGDSVRSTPSLRARHGHGDLARQAMESLIGLPANTHSLMDSSSTQTVAGADSIPPPLVNRCWQFSEEISHHGGCLQKERSAVRLEVPTGAIQRGDFVNIYQAVSVDLHRAAETLPIPEDEVIVSPVAEFYAGDGFRFRKPVCIVLPHLLPAGCTQHDLRVYHFCEDESREPQLRELQYRGRDCPQTTVGTADTYCFGEGSTVHIFVDHFSAVLCTKCKSQCFLPDLWLELFGHYTQLSESEWEVGLLLKIWDTEIVDFRQDDADKDSVHFSQMKKIDGKTLPAVALSGDGDTMKVLESTGISVKLALPCRLRQQWVHKTRDDGPHGEIHVHPPEQTFRLKQFALCDKHRSKWCQRKDWSLTNGPNVSPDRVFSAYVDVCYVTMVRTPTSDSRELSGDSDKITFEVRILHDGGGTNDSRLTQSGEGATGGNTNTHTTWGGDTGSGHWSHQTLLKVAERDPDETCRLQAETVQRSAAMAFQNVGHLNIVLPGASHPGIEQRGVRTPGTISPPTPTSPPWADAAGQSPVCGCRSSPGTAEERTAQNTNSGLDSLFANTAETVGQRTLSGQPFMADSRSLSFPSMNSENDTDV